MVLSEIVINDDPFIHIKYMIIYVNNNSQLTRETIESSYSNPKKTIILNILPEIVELIIVMLELNYKESNKTFKIKILQNIENIKTEETLDTIQQEDELNNKMELISNLFNTKHTTTSHQEIFDTMEIMGSGLSRLLDMSKGDTTNGGTQLNINKNENNTDGMIIKKKT